MATDCVKIGKLEREIKGRVAKELRERIMDAKIDKKIRELIEMNWEDQRS